MIEVFILVCAGLVGGFVGGLVGVGGGLIFAPVLFFYFQSVGVSPEVLAPATIGSSLFCTFIVALSSAHSQIKKNAVELRIAAWVGMASAIAAAVMTFYVTTRPWYDATVFIIIFSSLLLLVAIQMFSHSLSHVQERNNLDTVLSRGNASSVRTASREEESRDASARLNPLALLSTGTAAGVVATAAGVGGGIVMVPMYHRLFRLPILKSVGTSSTSIVLVSLFGVVSYALAGEGPDFGLFSVGFVDLGHAALLSVPAAFTARFGVRAAHRFNQRWLKRSFALLAVLVALRLLLSALNMV